MPHVINLTGCVANPEGRPLDFIARAGCQDLPFITVEVNVWRDRNTQELLFGVEVQPRTGGGPGVEMWAGGKHGTHPPVADVAP